MKKKILSILLVVCMVVGLLPQAAFAEGITPKTPQTDTEGVYQIGTAAELYGFAELVNSGGTDQNTKAVLTNDIIANTGVLKSDGSLADDVSGFTSWTPIGTTSNPYTGKFDGQGHTISGLYFNASTSIVGLFGSLGENGEIKNVGVIDSCLQGKSNVGGVCGYNDGGTISGCYNTSKISSTDVYTVNIGGVCGNNYDGTITDCYNTGTVSGYCQVGGICGKNDHGNTVTGCYNTGTVSGESEIGGVCGYNGFGSFCTITGCYNTGTVSGNFCIGGVCGKNDWGSTITGCYNIGTVSGGNHGGVCGINNRDSSITGCYINSGEVYGRNGSTVADCAKMSDEEFADGTVCKLLNTALQNANSDVRFCQRIGTDASPLLTHTDKNPKDHICDICGETISDHSYTREDTTIEGALKTAGTCTTESVYYYSCEVCGEVEKDDSHTFTGDKDANHHTGKLVWKTTETQHKQYYDCCNAVIVDADHTWNNGVCSECGYTCVHKDADKDNTCDYCSKNLSSGSSSSSSSSSGGFSGVYNYPVVISDVENAKATVDKTSAVAGDKVTITVTPDSGKAVDEVIVTDADGKAISVTKAGNNQYTFTMPAGKVNIAVTTKAADYQNKIVLQIGNRNIVENDATITNDVAPVIVDNRTMVPIRVITETLGGTAHWDADTQTVTLNMDGKTLTMTIGQTISGFDTAPIILNDRTYVPVRYVAEMLGAMVEWVGESQQIVITK